MKKKHLARISALLGLSLCILGSYLDHGWWGILSFVLALLSVALLAGLVYLSGKAMSKIVEVGDWIIKHWNDEETL